MRYLNQFKPATWQTMEIFNPRGLKPRDAVCECQIKAEGFAPVDFAIIEHDTGLYSFAHGMVIEPLQFKHKETAARAAMQWYEANQLQFRLAA